MDARPTFDNVLKIRIVILNEFHHLKKEPGAAQGALAAQPISSIVPVPWCGTEAETAFSMNSHLAT